MFDAVKTNIPGPNWTRFPEPLIAPPKTNVSERLNTIEALSSTLPVMLPVVPPLPTWSEPAEIAVPPVKVFEAVRTKFPGPICVMAPVPLMAPAKAALPARLNASMPLSTTLPTMLPAMPPLPTWSVPAEIVVPPV